ncbi:MAG: hypothetical protein H7Y20_09305 [Bryobacteraceae bacterium]|nr:hypothetical protein [Bryobacteraceae bacterium]
MRPVELALSLSVFVLSMIVVIGRLYTPRVRQGESWLALVVAILALIHVLSDGVRWQALPIYVAALPAMALWLTPNFPLVQIAMGLTCAALALLGIVLCHIIPVFSLPELTGPHKIGTTTLFLTDNSRTEVHDASQGGRRFVAQLWYPADDCSQLERSGYREPATLSWRSAHLRLVRSHACTDARPAAANGPRPIVFFSPSSGGSRGEMSYFLEDLASHGYVVVGLDHPYSSSRVAFPDGSVVRARADDWLELSSPSALASSLPRVEKTVATRAADVQFALHALEHGAVSGLAKQVAAQIDFRRAAIVGYSFGGSVAVELCSRDTSFVAGIDFDGWMFRNPALGTTFKPFLFVIEDDPLWNQSGQTSVGAGDLAREGTFAYHKTIRTSLRRWGGYLLKPAGSTHRDFGDLARAMRWPFPEARPAPDRIQSNTRDYARAFLDRYLKGIPDRRLQVSVSGRDFEFWSRQPDASN